MYQPTAFRTDDADALELTGAHPLAQLVVVADDVPSQNRLEVDQRRVAAALSASSTREQAIGRAMSGSSGD